MPVSWISSLCGRFPFPSLRRVAVSLPFLSVVGGVSMGFRPAPAQTPTRLVAEAVIWGADSGFKGYAFLPVTIQGHVATVVLDLNCTKCELTLATAGLARVGVTLSEPTGPLFEGLTIGTDTVHAAPLTMITKPTWSVRGPPQLPPVVGLVGVQFLKRYDLEYDFPARRVRLYAIPTHQNSADPNTTRAIAPSKAWLPKGFTPAECGPMVDIPPGAGTFTGVKMRINGHPVTGVLEMGPYVPKMNERALQTLGTPADVPAIHVTDPTPIYGDHLLIARVDKVAMTIGTRTFGAWDSEVLRAVDVQEVLPPDTPVMLMNLSMLRHAVLFNGMSSRQVCIRATNE